MSTTTSPPMFIPVPKPHGGTTLGNSYISLWHKCRRKWFLEHLYPNEAGGTGLRPKAGSLRLGKYGLMGSEKNLMLGSLLHSYREAWYESGIKDGEDTGQYSHDYALGKLAAYALQRQDEFEGGSDGEAFRYATTQVAGWCESFHKHFGTDGYTPLHPTEKVLCMEDGRPAIELELSVPLRYRNYVYTSRLDAVTLFGGKYLLAQEHKSAAPSWANRYVERLVRNSQFTGELWVLRNHPELRELPWEGVKVNFHLKGWTPKSSFSQPVLSGKVSRRPEALEAFHQRVIITLQEIESTVEQFKRRREAGDELTVLMDELFPETGENTGECYAYMSDCVFIDLCKMGVGPSTLGRLRPARAGEPGAPEEEV